MYDLLLRGGGVLDPSSGRKGPMDIAFAGGRVAAIEGGIAPSMATRVVPAEGLTVTPGLIDIHAHAFAGVGISVSADTHCLQRGSTTVVDAGSAGSKLFGAFAHVASDSRARLLAWLNLSTIGQVDIRVGELLCLLHADPDDAVAVARTHPDLIVGFKARLSSDVVGTTCKPVLRLLRAAGDEAGLPVMVHIGNTGEPLEEILSYLRPGDVVSHILTGRKNGILASDGTIFPSIVEAHERGVLFDVARGSNHLSFPVLRAAVEQGLLPDILSTDITVKTAVDPYFGLPMVATQLLAFGVPLETVLERMTTRPAKAIGREELGRLEVGGNGDATLLQLEEGDFTLRDSDGRALRVSQRLVAAGVVRAGVYFPVTTASDN